MSNMHKPKRSDIIEAVLQIIMEDGPDNVGAIAVARKLGVAPLTPYEHFTGREEMVSAALDEIHSRLLKKFNAAMRQGTDPLDRLRIFTEQSAEMLPFVSVIPRILFGGSQHGDVWNQRIRVREEQVEARLKSLLRDARKAGQVRGDMTEQMLVRAYLGCASQAYNRWARTDGQLDLKQETAQLWKKFSDTVAPWSTAGPAERFEEETA